MHRRLSWLAILLLAVTTVACATASSRPADLVAGAVQAMGGADALAQVKTVWMKGTVRQWEPEQSMVPGGEMRLAGDSTFEVLADVAARATRIDWVRAFQDPAPRSFTFSEIVTPEAGYVAGIDSNLRTRQSLDANPPAHSMSGLRLAATQRELRRISPGLLLAMLRDRDSVTVAPEVTIGSTTYPAVEYRVAGQTFTVLFDRQTSLPARVRTLDYDNIWGDVTYDVVFADWRAVDGVRLPMRRTYELNARTVQDVRIDEVKLNAPVAAGRLAIPPAFAVAAAKPASGALVPYQWVLRRQFIGIYLDSDQPGYDARGSQGLRLVDLAPNVQHVVGGTHNSLLVELAGYLVVFDAPVSDAQSNWVLSAAKQRYPGKAVKYLVLTHHHMDHAGGLRAYAAQGATLVVGKGAGEHYRRVLAAPFRRNPDMGARDLTATPIVEVADRWAVSDGIREVQAYPIENPHAASSLIGYVPDERLGFVTDLWSPSSAPLPAKLTPAQASVVAAVKKNGITPLRFAGGHGGVGDYEPLEALDGQ